MKIIPGKYPEEKNWQKWIRFKYPHGCNLSIVFIWRLAALARDRNTVMSNTLGYRSKEETQRLWDLDVAKNKGKPSGKVAVSGTSWHEFNLAVDLDGLYWKNKSQREWLPYARLKQPLNKYGLILPLNKIDSPNVLEWWHIQPIETAMVTKFERSTFLEGDDIIFGLEDEAMTVIEFQKKTGLEADGVAGPKTMAKLLEIANEYFALKESLEKILKG